MTLGARTLALLTMLVAAAKLLCMEGCDRPTNQ